MNANLFKTAFAALALLVAFNSCKEDKTKYLIEIIYDSEQGTVTGGGEYEEGEKVTITAIANPGYCFERWEGYASEDSVITITARANISYTAIFSKIESSEYGSVKISISQEGSYYIYEARPNENCFFLKWSDGSYEQSKIVYVSTGETLTATFKPYPEGSIHALFSVGKGKRVIFSKGNLQFNPTLGTHTRADGTIAPGTWRFAEKQNDNIIADTVISATYDGWIDDFAWGTSGWSGSGATYYQPYDGIFYNFDGNISDSIAQLYGPQGNYDLIGDYAYADWGVYNPISNGGNKPGMWRTLTKDEFYSIKRTPDIISEGRSFDDLYGYVFGFDRDILWNIKTINDISKYNEILFLASYIREYWTASYSKSSTYGALTYSPSHSDEIVYRSYRSERHPVRLVMDVDE